MKKILTLAMAVMLCAGSAMAVDHIGIYSDNVNMDQCSMAAPLFAPFNIYVVHKYALASHGGAAGSQFKVVNPVAGITFLSGTPTAPFLQIGTPTNDWTIAYAACQSSDAFAIASLSYFAAAAPPACTVIQIVPGPSAPSGQVESINCVDVSDIATGGSFHFSPDGTCDLCDEPGPPNAARTSTWGNIKSLYR